MNNEENIVLTSLNKIEYNKNPNKCIYCKNNILADEKHRLSYTKKQKFCSYNCRIQYNRQVKVDEYNKNPKICKTCGKPIIANSYDHLRMIRNYKFCSLDCAYKNRDTSNLKFCKNGEKLKKERSGETNKNNQGILMKIIDYKDSLNVVVEFQDSTCYTTTVTYKNFIEGSVLNPFIPTIYGVGVFGNKYPSNTKEYYTWMGVLERSFDEKYKERNPTYKDVICCDEWLSFENFCEWLHSQENFEKWYDLKLSAIDKDILIKGNKIYSPDTCCLVPQNVNALFIKRNFGRGEFPIGVSLNKSNKTSKIYEAHCNDGYGISRHLGTFKTPEEAFYLGYKPYKENLIKKISQEEYKKGNITKKCYEAMMNYIVEITD